MDLAKIRRLVNDVEQTHKDVIEGCITGNFNCSLGTRSVWGNLDSNSRTIVATIIIRSYVERIFLKIAELEECGVTFDDFQSKEDTLETLIENYKRENS